MCICSVLKPSAYGPYPLSTGFCSRIGKSWSRSPLLWAVLADDVGRYVVGIFVGEDWTTERCPQRHVVHRISAVSENGVHTRAIVVAVWSPERWELITRTSSGTLAHTISSMADTANLGIHGSTAAGIGCMRRLLDAQGAGADQ